MSELIARLGPTTCRFDIGSGGKKELTAQDIAAALGMVKNKSGALILEYLHCANDNRKAQIEDACFDFLRAEYSRRWNEAVNAELRLLLQPGRRIEATRLYVCAAKGRWPAMSPEAVGTYVRVVFGVLQEIAQGSTCKVCNGAGKTTLPTGNHECQACGGTGIAKRSQRDRARLVGVGLDPYQRKWQEPYTWLLGELLSAWSEANAQFRSAIGSR